MILGIDASNIRAGGGLTHMKELLKHSNHPKKYGFSKVVIWGGKKTIDQIPEKKWLEKITVPILSKSLPFILLWRLFHLQKYAKKCDILLSPSGTFYSRSIPYVSVCQNMLIFEKKERNRYFFSLNWLRYIILYFAQKRSFKRAVGVIFVSHYISEYVQKIIPIDNSQVIYHGVSQNFSRKTYEEKNRFHLLYVSTIAWYKHQWNVVVAVNNLIEKGFSIDLHIIGTGYKNAIKKLNSVMQNQTHKKYIHYHGFVPHQKIHTFYLNANAFVFASTCESISIVLIEAMAASLPIICSSYGPTKEIVADAGIYFDPLSIKSIENAIEKVVSDKNIQLEMRKNSQQNSLKFTWENCAHQTFCFLKHSYEKQEVCN